MLRIGLFICYLAFSPGDEVWKTKRVADWTDQETKEILTNSPWAVMTVPTVKKEEKKSHGNMGIGVPGIGRHRTNPDPAQDPTPSPSDSALSLNLRWESALPIREAELKARETNAPVVEENYYGIAVYGLPSKLGKDPKSEGDHLKGQAALKREGQKDLKPARVEVIQRDDGVVVVFLFPRTKEITAKDSRIEFDATIGQYQIAQQFHVDEMIYQGKLEL
ncbi:MAG TPA: hypothetical protein VK752_06825 [Bryobacteraceae bacterium]|jgi:hypothetical protein|nr:hypothetical protein [Bryobacteraceae bacterium]